MWLFSFGWLLWQSKSGENATSFLGLIKEGLKFFFFFIFILFYLVDRM